VCRIGHRQWPIRERPRCGSGPVERGDRPAHARRLLQLDNLKMDSNVYSGGALLFPDGSRLNLSPEYTASLSADYGFAFFATGSTDTFRSRQLRVQHGEPGAAGRGQCRARRSGAHPQGELLTHLQERLDRDAVRR